MIATISGRPSAPAIPASRFRPLIDLYYEAGKRAGHPREQLKVGIHAIGYVADTTEQAADEFFPGYADAFTKIGKERGWPPTTRAHYDALRGPTGALIVGDAATAAEKILRISESLGGIARLSFQMSVATLPHVKLMRATEIIGDQVAPMVKKALAPANA
jgi:alkanesulfonate monooxygenase SsuD/methylene tetrahydromethanopterin reductase-like flavin-dependent oxidoreductase (luciferase family)